MADKSLNHFDQEETGDYSAGRTDVDPKSTFEFTENSFESDKRKVEKFGLQSSAVCSNQTARPSLLVFKAHTKISFGKSFSLDSRARVTEVAESSKNRFVDGSYLGKTRTSGDSQFGLDTRASSIACEWMRISL